MHVGIQTQAWKFQKKICSIFGEKGHFLVVMGLRFEPFLFKLFEKIWWDIMGCKENNNIKLIPKKNKDSQKRWSLILWST